VPRYDLVVVGSGSAGLIAAELAAQLELRVAVVEESRIGGDCLWTGCVPSKALLAAGRAAHAMRTAGTYGLRAVEPEVDLPAVWSRIRRVQEEIAAAEDSPDRLAELGVELVRGHGRLAGPHAVEVDGRTLESRFVLLATGSRPAIPEIDGLADAGYLTSETLWALDEPPRRVAVIGGGPMGVELAQGLRRLGTAVTLFQRRQRLLPQDEPELTSILERVLRDEGVDVRLGAEVRRVEHAAATTVTAAVGGEKVVVAVDAVIVATGRVPRTTGLGLEDAGVRVGRRGVAVDRALRTSTRSVYAVGDVVGRPFFTHAAANEAAIAVRNMFLPWRSQPSRLVPWTTFTDPELASVGLGAHAAAERYGAARVRVWRQDLSASDRARADGRVGGAVTLVTARGRLVGAHVLAPSAGELISELTLAIGRRMHLRDLAAHVHVYPTYSTSVQRLAGDAAYELARRFRFLVRRVR